MNFSSGEVDWMLNYSAFLLYFTKLIDLFILIFIDYFEI